MGTSNYISRRPGTGGGGGSGTLSTSQPVDENGDPAPGLWMNNGVLTFFDGTQNREIDFSEGEVLDAFGNPRGIDI